MPRCGQLPAAGCMRHQQQTSQPVQLQQSRQPITRDLLHRRSRCRAHMLSPQAVQTAERPAAALPGGIWPSVQERISAFGGRGVAVESPPLSDMQLPTLADSRHKVRTSARTLPLCMPKAATPEGCCVADVWTTTGSVPQCYHMMMRHRRRSSSLPSLGRARQGLRLRSGSRQQASGCAS